MKVFDLLTEQELPSSIRELNRMKEQALEEYHEKVRIIDSHIDSIRGQRKTRLKEPSHSGYHEPGRDRPRRPGNW